MSDINAVLVRCHKPADGALCVKCGDPIEPDNECENDYPTCFPCQGAPDL